MRVIDRVEEKRMCVCVCICELMYCRDRIINYGKEEENSEKMKAKHTATAVHIFHLSSEDVTSARYCERPKVFSHVFLYTTRKAEKIVYCN